MNRAAKLERLEHLYRLVEQYVTKMYENTEDGKRLHREICEVYGQVEDVFRAILGQQRIEVPNAGGRGSSVYPNYFEAGFLSGRSIHTHQGMTELLKVIGQMKSQESSFSATPNKSSTGNRVFLVHGHDEANLQACARFLEKLELTVTILHEKPNQGRTLIEKFVDHSDVAFAVVLLTADDQGGPVSVACEHQRPRARQNVVFELGFFLGKLGRSRVCALYDEGVELPSDYAGVAFVPLDGRKAWRLELAKEFQAAGLPVDMNRAV